MDCLEALYTSRNQAEEEDAGARKEEASTETRGSAVGFGGDKAFAQGGLRRCEDVLYHGAGEVSGAGR